MRKRHAARPMLESVEDRVVLSALGVLDPAAEVTAAIAGLVAHPTHASTASAKHDATNEGTRSDARAAHHQTTSTAHHAHHSSSSSSSLTSSFSSFLKSIGF